MKFPSLKGFEIKVEVLESGIPIWSVIRDGHGVVLDYETVEKVYRLFGYLFYNHKVDSLINELLDEPYIIDNLK